MPSQRKRANAFDDFPAVEGARPVPAASPETPQPANPAVEPIFAHEDDVVIQGVVVGVIRKY